ncbi:MAG: isoleucine--tRNA ligase [Planctomycetaceae bacterium]
MPEASRTPFEPVPPHVSFPSMEKELLGFWEKERIFARTVERDGPRFTFYEGPPTANGLPHHGSVLTRVVKDVFLRYKTMRGFRVPRRGGWDTHGLPVEVEVEKELGIHGKHEIERYGVEAFTRRCIDSVFRYIGEWSRMSERVALWMDFKSAYVTFHRSYVESVWWALSELFRKGLLYQDYKVVWWWPQGGTALSAGEVGQGYREVDDPSVVVRFPVKGRDKTALLAWTTTPWTLPSNAALAVKASVDYVEARDEEGWTSILAQARLKEVFGKRAYTVVKEMKGEALEGVAYEPVLPFRSPGAGKAYEVVCDDFVTLDTGTGIVHVAPGFGEEDFRVAREKGIGFLQVLEPDGTFPADGGFVAGRNFKEADRELARDLKRRGLLFSEATCRHEYPFCWRADKDPLVQYARRSWFIRTTKEIGLVRKNNGRIRWQPEHIGEGRFGDFLRNNVDWALSRERWWGTPLPIWVNDETGAMEAVASVDEILARNPQAFRAFEEARRADPSLSEHLQVHKPWIDEVTWKRPGQPGVWRRVPEVIDCWFDSGCMPFAQWGYPHANREAFEESFPADFITEAVDQTRGWFHALLQISTLLFPDREMPHPFKSCVVLGHITDKEGLKLSKSRKNYEPPMATIEEHGADAVRWALLANNVPGLNTRFHAGIVKDATRDLLLKTWNVYSFFVTYANVDRFDPSAPRPPLAHRPALDRWILAELDDSVRGATAAFEELNSYAAARKIQDFVEALSNWYVRRSRARFWAEGQGDAKRAAFATLHEALLDLARLLAPFTPFLAEAIHKNLGRGGTSPVSVHLDAFPAPRDERRDEPLRRAMALLRHLVALGQRVRAEHNLKVRQPLPKAVVVLCAGEEGGDLAPVREELNVEEIEVTDRPQVYVEFTVLPNFRALGPKLGPRLPALKAALGRADGGALYAELERTDALVVTLPDGAVTLGRDEVEVRLKAREGYAAAGERGRVVVLDTRLTDSLRRKGLAREVINRIQQARKAMDLPYEARIKVTWRAQGELAEALKEHAAYIAGETLTVSLEPGELRGDRHDSDVEGSELSFGILR